jgi:pyruvate carboxylase subunit B
MVVRVEVDVGQNVKKGDGLVIVEAMKMENELKVAYPGTVKEIKVKAGQPVEKNQPLVVFE